MNDRGVDATFVHQSDGLLRGDVRHRPMRLTARQAGRPEIDLRIDHQEDRSSMENARRPADVSRCSDTSHPTSMIIVQMDELLRNKRTPPA